MDIIQSYRHRTSVIASQFATDCLFNSLFRLTKYHSSASMVLCKEPPPPPQMRKASPSHDFIITDNGTMGASRHDTYTHTNTSSHASSLWAIYHCSFGGEVVWSKNRNEVDIMTYSFHSGITLVSHIHQVLRSSKSTDYNGATDMKTSSNGNIFRVTGHFCGGFTGHRRIPRTKARDAEPWCFLWYAPE